MNLVKIYAKKHHNVPGPEKYNTNPKWVFTGNQKYKCKFQPGSRITSTEDIIQTAKRTKTPGPNVYKVQHKCLSSERRVTTTTGMMSKTDQLQMFGDRAWYAK